MKNNLLKYTILLNTMLLFNFQSNAQKIFQSLDSLLKYGEQNSSSLKSSSIKIEQAKKAKLAALVGILDINGNVSLTATNNTRLPLNLFPAETFGGKKGEYIKVQTGIQYNNNFVQSADAKLINIQGIKNNQLAKLNLNFTQTESKLNRKTLYENIASSYFNIVMLQEQLECTKKSCNNADSIYILVSRKKNLGLVKQQDLNEVEINKLNTKENKQQLEWLIKQQYAALKLLLDIPESIDILIQSDKLYNATFSKTEIKSNDLIYRQEHLREQMALTTLQQNRSSLFPILSVFASNSNQQFSTDFSLFSKNTSWITSNYVGFKLAWQLPSATSITQISKSKFDYQISKENAKHAAIKSQLDNQQLILDFNKSLDQLNTNRSIMTLKIDTYEKNLSNYNEGIIALEALLNSFNAAINSEYNYISSCATLLLSKTKIDINNSIQ